MAGRVAGGIVASAVESDAWIAVTWVAWIVGPIAALLATWALLRWWQSPLRVVASMLVCGAWRIVAIVFWMLGVALGGGADV